MFWQEFNITWETLVELLSDTKDQLKTTWRLGHFWDLGQWALKEGQRGTPEKWLGDKADRNHAHDAHDQADARDDCRVQHPWGRRAEDD